MNFTGVRHKTSMVSVLLHHLERSRGGRSTACNVVFIAYQQSPALFHVFVHAQIMGYTNRFVKWSGQKKRVDTTEYRPTRKEVMLHSIYTLFIKVSQVWWKNKTGRHNEYRPYHKELQGRSFTLYHPAEGWSSQFSKFEPGAILATNLFGHVSVDHRLISFHEINS